MKTGNWDLQQWNFAVAVLTLLATAVCGVFAGLALRRPTANVPITSEIATAPRPKKGSSAILWSIATVVLLLITIALMTQLREPGAQGPQGPAGAQGPPGMPDAHVATAYWYRVELNKFKELFGKWNNATEKQLKSYLENRGEIPYSDDNDLGGIEATIKDVVRNDFGVELNFSRHPRFDSNRLYPAPNVEQIVKDYDKEEYRRLYDQYSQTKYTLDQVRSAYEMQILIQDDYIMKHIERPKGCRYQQTGNGNFNCP